MHLQRSKLRKSHVLALSLIMVFLLLPGCIGQEEAPPETVTQTLVTTEAGKEITKVTTITQEAVPATDPDTLVIGLDTSTALDFEPAAGTSVTTTSVMFQTYEQLVGFRGTDLSTIYPELAESWSKSADGLTWTFNLRQDVDFHSSNHMTADDVVWSLQRTLSLQLQSVFILERLGLTVDLIKKVDEYTVQLIIDKPYSDFLVLSLLSYITGSVLDKKLVLEHEQKTTEFPDGDWGLEWVAEHDAGSGPFILDHWTKLNEIVIVRNDNWWGGTAGLKQIIYKDIPEPTTEMLMLQRGDIDIAYDLRSDQVNDLRGYPGVRIQEHPSWWVNYLALNFDFEPFRNAKVREALRWAIDYNGIVNQVLGGAAVVTQTFIPPGMLGHNPSKPYVNAPEKARALLEEAGYANGFDVEMLCPNVSPHPEIAAKIQADLEAVGIRIKITQMVSGEMYQIYRARNHQMILAHWLSDYFDPDALATVFAHCDALDDATIKLVAWRNKIVDPELAAMADAAALEPDEATRISLYMEIQELARVNYVCIYTESNQQGVRTWVENYEVGATDYFDLWPVYKEAVA